MHQEHTARDAAISSPFLILPAERFLFFFPFVCPSCRSNKRVVFLFQPAVCIHILVPNTTQPNACYGDLEAFLFECFTFWTEKLKKMMKSQPRFCNDEGHHIDKAPCGQFCSMKICCFCFSPHLCLTFCLQSDLVISFSFDLCLSEYARRAAFGAPTCICSFIY